MTDCQKCRRRALEDLIEQKDEDSEIEELGDGMLSIALRCWRCHERHEVVADSAALESWAMGAPILSALPEHTDAERELLISATCDPCWDVVYGDD